MTFSKNIQICEGNFTCLGCFLSTYFPPSFERGIWLSIAIVPTAKGNLDVTLAFLDDDEVDLSKNKEIYRSNQKESSLAMRKQLFSHRRPAT